MADGRDNNSGNSKTIYDDTKRILEEQNAAKTTPKNLFEVLGVSPNATRDEFRAAYKAEVKKYHPDVLASNKQEITPEIEERIKKIGEANDTFKLKGGGKESSFEDEQDFQRRRDNYLRKLEQLEQTENSRSYPSQKSGGMGAAEGTSFIVPEGYEFQQSAGELGAGAPQLGSGSPQLGSGVGQLASGQVKNQIGKKVVGEVGKKLATEAAKQGASKATQMAATAAATATGAAMSMGTTLALQAGMMALSNVDKIAKGLMGAVIALPSLFATGVGAAVSGTMSSMAIALVTVPLILATFVIIINTGAYVVPMDEGFGLLPEVTVAREVECFAFDTSWSQNPRGQANITAAIGRILARPGANDRICSGNPINLFYVATGLSAGGRVISANDIQISPLGAGTGVGSGPNTPLYTLAHELGHILNRRYSSFLTTYQAVSPTVADGKWLPSYGCITVSGACTYPYDDVPPLSESHNVGESIAEASALWLMIPTQHSAIGNYQTNYPAHYEFANRFYTQ